MPTAILTPRKSYPSSPVVPGLRRFVATTAAGVDPWVITPLERASILDAVSVFMDVKASVVGRLQLRATTPGTTAGGGFSTALLSPTVPLALATSPSALVTIVSSTTGAAPVFTTSGNHGLAAGEIIRITGSNSTPGMDGTWVVSTIPLATTFTVVAPPTLTVQASSGALFVSGFDLQKPQRYTYYSDELTTLLPTITGNTAANPSVFTTSAAHGLVVGQTITITNSNSVPSANGTWLVDTVPSGTTFTVLLLGAVTTAGTGGNVNIAGPTLQGASPTGVSSNSGMGLILPENSILEWALTGGAGAKTGVFSFVSNLWLRDYQG